MLRLKGIVMILLGSMLWGTTGSITEWLLENKNLSVPILLTVRLIIAGIAILTLLLLKKEAIFSVWKSSSWRNQLILFSIFGMVGLQFTFASAIEASNAVIATLLQFSAPIFVVLYVSLTYKAFPPRYQLIGIFGTLTGLFLLLTNGSISNLLVSGEALLWGVTVGLTFAFYTLYPSRLMREWSVLLIVGWSMLIGGVLVGVFYKVWESNEWSILVQQDVTLKMIILIVFSTIAFFLFLNSMKYISSIETSILSSVEPLTVMAISVFWFHTMLQSVQLLGALLMLLFVSWLSVGGKKAPVKRKRVQHANAR